MKNLQLIDFETRFTKDLLAWCAKHRDIAADEEKMGELTPMFYEKWRSSPKEWLDGKSPDAYFEEIEDMQALLSMMIDYILIGKQPPVSLTERILSEPEKAYPILLGIIHAKESEEMDAEQLNRVKYETVCLIQEMDEEHPIDGLY